MKVTTIIVALACVPGLYASEESNHAGKELQ